MNLLAKYLLGTLCMGLVFINTGSAQTDSIKPNKIGWHIIMPFEFPVIDIRNLNNQLNAAGLPSADYANANIGIGVQYHHNHYAATFSFNKTTRRKEDMNSLSEVAYHSTSLNLSYDLLHHNHFYFSPYAGIKFTGLNYTYREKAPRHTSFNTYIQTPLQYKEINNLSPNLDFGLAFSFKTNYLISIKGGYLVPMNRSSMNMINKASLTDAPSINYNYYFVLTFGIGAIYHVKPSSTL